jgi:predicted SAM-dependent methyltransferase
MFDFRNTKLSTKRPLRDYGKLQRVYGSFVRGNRLQLRKPQLKLKKYLNLGCGANIVPDFISLDYCWVPGIDICWDATKGIPLPDKSLDGIFTEHCLEHVSFTQCGLMLKEFRRLLKPGGCVRIVVPDGELYLDLYQSAKMGDRIEFPYQSIDEVTPMMCVNRVFREYGHLFAYDAKTLETLLLDAGFSHFEKLEFRRGRDKQLLIDSEDRKSESLYVEAY